MHVELVLHERPTSESRHTFELAGPRHRKPLGHCSDEVQLVVQRLLPPTLNGLQLPLAHSAPDAQTSRTGLLPIPPPELLEAFEETLLDVVEPLEAIALLAPP